ncbi:MAG: ABC transporter permease [Acidimicrobiales bacterium]
MIRRLRARAAPYLLVLPGGLWLAIFFIVPIVALLALSLETGDIVSGFTQTFHFGNYADVLSLYHDQFIRSFVYGLIATAAMILIGYPMAYWIAFRGGRHKSTFLFLMLLPFFVTFVLRTVSWQFLLADNGVVLGTLKSWGLLPQSFHVLATSFAVIAGLTYNFLPYMVLPIYVALERMDKGLLDAAADLYASRRAAFRRVVLPLSIPGVFAGVLLTFVPAVSDYVNAEILGGPGQVMIGNVIQTLYLTNNDYPSASALSFVLMAALLVGVVIYARALGTRDVMDMSAA